MRRNSSVVPGFLKSGNRIAKTPRGMEDMYVGRDVGEVEDMEKG